MNNLNQLTISSAGIAVKVQSEDESIISKIKESEFLSKYIPGLEIQKEGDSEPMAYLKFSKEIPFIDFDNYPRIKINPDGMTLNEVVTLIELVLERARQGQGIYCIHSSCALYRDMAIIFWGDVSGMGKTSLAEAVGLLNNGRFYSDEKTLLSLAKGSVVGGIGYVNHSKKSKNSDGYEKIIDNRTDEKFIDKLVYGLVNEKDDLWAVKWTNDKFEWHLYEELSRKIRATSRRVINGRKSVPSIDIQELADKRISEVRKFVQMKNCYQVAGNLQEITAFLTARGK